MRDEAGDAPWALPCKRDRFGLRTRRVHAPTLIHDIAERLKDLAGSRETGPARAYVEEALRCSYWGLRVLALGVLAAWGGRHDKDRLMALAERPISPMRAADRAERWRDLETRTARRALASLLSEADGPWLLDAWFGDSGWLFDLLAAGLGLIPPRVLEARLATEAASDEASRRLGVLRLVAAHRTVGGGAELVRSLVNDPDPQVRGFAEALARQFAASQNRAPDGSASGGPPRKPTRERARPRTRTARR